MSTLRLPCAAWFGDEEVAATPLGGSGFSGSPVLLVRRASGERFVLKSFAPHVSPERATWVHALLAHLAMAGLNTVPRLQPRRAGARVPPGLDSDCKSLVADDVGRLWELVTFLPGSPRQAPSADESQTALAALARLHDAAAMLSGSRPAIEPSAGVSRRVSQAARMQATPWRLLEPLARHTIPPDIAALVLTAIEAFESHDGAAALKRIATSEPVALAVQPVLRDVWSDHVLFQDDGRLAGFIDFHAAGRDTPATDLARLLGSWDAAPAMAAVPLAARWRHALDAYEAERPLAPQERQLVPWLHATGVICGLDNWFRWLITEQREFADSSSVQARIARLVRQLPDALGVARNTGPGRD